MAFMKVGDLQGWKVRLWKLRLGQRRGDSAGQQDSQSRRLVGASNRAVPGAWGAWGNPRASPPCLLHLAAVTVMEATAPAQPHLAHPAWDALRADWVPV